MRGQTETLPTGGFSSVHGSCRCEPRPSACRRRASTRSALADDNHLTPPGGVVALYATRVNARRHAFERGKAWQGYHRQAGWGLRFPTLPFLSPSGSEYLCACSSRQSPRRSARSTSARSRNWSACSATAGRPPAVTPASCPPSFDRWRRTQFAPPRTALDASPSALMEE
jgi:hypothetical protein